MRSANQNSDLLLQDFTSPWISTLPTTYIIPLWEKLIILLMQLRISIVFLKPTQMFFPLLFQWPPAYMPASERLSVVLFLWGYSGVFAFLPFIYRKSKLFNHPPMTHALPDQ